MVNWHYVYLGSLSFPGSRTVILVTPCLARRQKELVAQLTVRADKLAGQHIPTGNIVDHNRVKVLHWQSMMVVQSIPIVAISVSVITNSAWSRGTYRNFGELYLQVTHGKFPLSPTLQLTQVSLCWASFSNCYIRGATMQSLAELMNYLIH